LEKEATKYSGVHTFSIPIQVQAAGLLDLFFCVAAFVFMEAVVSSCMGKLSGSLQQLPWHSPAGWFLAYI
jgi:hypothetical protein